ncbi:MAG: S41 family peptidase [Chlorobi bacterium]|nr:S41 family peptidase [Chlorobiota bacterium]
MNNRNSKISIYLPIAFAFVLVAGMWIGSLLDKQQVSNTSIFPFGNVTYTKVDDVIDYISHNYVDSVDVDEMETFAIDGMLQDLDPHSQYIPADELKEVNDPLMGSFEGIGISFRIEKDTITVINPIAGGPSEKVGLMAGDRIVKIDDSLAVGISNSMAIKKLKGPKGTKVKVSVFRRGVPRLMDFTITRDVIPTYSLDIAYMVTGDIGYIKLNKFSATTFKEFDKAAKDLKNQGMTKLILDLRGNAGGFLRAAINVADEFLADGKLIVYTEGRNRPRNYAFATSKGELLNDTLAVLIDEGTASASEIVAGAIQDNDRGLIIGRRSFGKGLVQEQISLPDGSALRLTVARYYTPTGRCIQRPYEKDKFEDYYTDWIHRYEDGEMTNADSIRFNDSLKYTTPGGKTVYGGGGIMPDIYVPLITDSVHTFYNSLANKGIIFQFAFDYTDAHRAALQKFKDFESFDRGFNMSNKDYKDLVAYAAEKGITASKEKIKVSRDKIKILFKAYVGRNILNEKGFYPIYHEIDTTFKRAVYELEK